MATEYHAYKAPHNQYVHYETHHPQPHRRQPPLHDTTSRNYPYDTTTTSSASASKVVAVITLLPVGGTLLLLSGLTLAATIIGLAIASPLFVIFSPVLVPAALAVFLAVAGFITSGAFGVTAVSALTWMAQHVRRIACEVAPEARNELAYLRRRGQDTAEYIGQRTKDAGQAIQDKAHDLDRDYDVGVNVRGQFHEGSPYYDHAVKGQHYDQGGTKERESVGVKSHEHVKSNEGGGKNK